MASRRATPVSDTFDPTLVADAEKRVRELGAVVVSKVIPKGLSRTGQAAFVEALARVGLERTGTRIRVPVDDQLVARLAEGPVPIAGLQKRLAGASLPELKRSVLRLSAAGAAVILVREGKEWLSLPSDKALPPETIEALKVCAKRLATMLGWVKPKKISPPRTLDRDDVAALLLLLPLAPAEQPPDAIAPTRRVLEAIRNTTDAHTGLARVPEAVRSVLGVMSASDACSSLLRLHSDGLIELRPESGIGLLSEQDASLCPRGPRGIVLSFARLLGQDSVGNPT